MDCRRILVVDDEEGIRKLLATAFKGAGYDVRVAGDAQQAMAICDSESFDVVLSDVVMPGKNGHELARWIVTKDPRTRTVLMSGFDEAICQGCGIPARPCSWLQKPFLPREAIALVNGIFNESSEAAFVPVG